jgi:hypothetical protein
MVLGNYDGEEDTIQDLLRSVDFSMYGKEGLYGRHSWAGNTRTGKASKKGTTFIYVLIVLACTARVGATLIVLSPYDGGLCVWGDPV